MAWMEFQNVDEIANFPLYISSAIENKRCLLRMAGTRFDERLWPSVEARTLAMIFFSLKNLWENFRQIFPQCFLKRRNFYTKNEFFSAIGVTNDWCRILLDFFPRARNVTCCSKILIGKSSFTNIFLPKLSPTLTKLRVWKCIYSFLSNVQPIIQIEIFPENILFDVICISPVPKLGYFEKLPRLSHSVIDHSN